MTVISEVAVEYLDLEAEPVPPCEAWLLPMTLHLVCGQPSAVRVRITCSCGLDARYFLCAADFAKTRKGRALCGGCQRIITKWAET
jgi:hypothetical protein